MSEENLNPDDTGNDEATSLLGDNPPTEEVNENPTNEESNEAPENYEDFNLPEGMEVDTEFLGQGTEVLKEIGLNQEQAQKVVDLYAGQMAAQGDAVTNQITQWQNEARSNSEYGGDAFDANIALARNALDKFADEETITMLNETGLGNHPALIGMLVKVGKMTAEDNPDLGGRGGDKLSREEIMYPDANT